MQQMEHEASSRKISNIGNLINQYSNHTPHASIKVTNFDLVSLIDQNNLSDDSCLIVVENKVYDLTLWIQDRLSCNQPNHITRHTRATSFYSNQSSSHPSPPPSPAVASENLSSSLSSPSNPFDRLLAQAKIDPVQAGHLLQSTYHQTPRSSDRTTRLEDWLHEYRIGDFSPTEPNPPSSSPFLHQQTISTSHSILLNHSSFSASTANPTIPSNLPTPLTSNPFPPNRQHPHALSHGYRTTASATEHPLGQSSRDGNLNLIARGSSSIGTLTSVHGSSTSSIPPSSIRPPDPARSDHLERASQALKQAQQQVADAERGVGIANLSLTEAWGQLTKAQMIIDHLIHQACEGFRPIWHEWEDDSQ